MLTMAKINNIRKERRKEIYLAFEEFVIKMIKLRPLAVQERFHIDYNALGAHIEANGFDLFPDDIKREFFSYITTETEIVDYEYTEQTITTFKSIKCFSL